MIDENDVINMLDNISKELDFDQDGQNKSFNIFKILKIENNEILICRLLGALLDPRYRVENPPLKSFIEDVLNVYNEGDYSNARVVLEERVSHSDENDSNNRRVDIVIHTKKRVYPIEVKIWAGDQSKQLYDYYHHFFGKSKDDMIYYLTPDGHVPSKDSMGTLEKHNIKNLSFKIDIKRWLDGLHDDNQIIKQFSEVIEEMSENKPNLENIKRLISFDDDDCDNKKNQTLWFLCKNSEKILKDIESKYIMKYIKTDNSFSIIELNEDNENNAKNEYYHKNDRCFVRSEKDEYFKAWLSVDSSGIYLVVKPKKEYKRLNGVWNLDRGYCWTRITDKNDKNILCQDSLDINSYETIDISELLNQALEL